MAEERKERASGFGSNVIIAVLVAAFVGGVAFLVYQRESAPEYAEILEINVAEMAMVVAIRFNEAPDTGDPREVRLVLESEAFPDTIEYDWREISRRDDDSLTHWNREPPLDHIIRVHIHAGEFRQERYEGSPVIGATLEWAGRVVDTARGEVTPMSVPPPMP